jgi:hypothetical protein
MRDADWEKVVDAAAAIEHTVERQLNDDRWQQVRDEVEGIVTVLDLGPPGDLAAYALRRFAAPHDRSQRQRGCLPRRSLRNFVSEWSASGGGLPISSLRSMKRWNADQPASRGRPERQIVKERR